MAPRHKDWTQFGVYVGSPKAIQIWKAMRPDAIKVAHGRIQHFCPKDENAWAFFPYGELKAYEAEEISAGRDAIFVTATYEGKKRPVYFKWSLGSPKDGETPKRHQTEWKQLVNVQDDRYVRFWAEHYAHKIMPSDIRNMWMGADDCAFMYSLYGVLDDEGKFVSNVKWDRPFPQNNDEFLRAVAAFFRKLKRTAPDIKVMCNLGSLQDWRKFPEVYADVPGIMNENIVWFLDIDVRDYVRAKVYQNMMWYTWAAEQKKVVLLRAVISNNDEQSVRTALMTYLLVRGDNFFFAPQGLKVMDIVDMNRVATLQSAIGKPIEKLQTQVDPGTQKEGFRLYTRRCQNGIVYLNMTGKRKTVPLPENQTYYDRFGQRIREITLNDLEGGFALTRPNTNDVSDR